MRLWLTKCWDPLHEPICKLWKQLQENSLNKLVTFRVPHFLEFIIKIGQTRYAYFLSEEVFKRNICKSPSPLKTLVITENYFCSFDRNIWKLITF